MTQIEVKINSTFIWWTLKKLNIAQKKLNMSIGFLGAGTQIDPRFWTVLYDSVAPGKREDQPCICTTLLFEKALLLAWDWVGNLKLLLLFWFILFYVTFHQGRHIIHSTCQIINSTRPHQECQPKSYICLNNLCQNCFLLCCMLVWIVSNNEWFK